MSFSLYDAIIPRWLQMLSSATNIIDKAEAYCAETNIPAATLISAKLAEDMLPFAYQIKSCKVHTLGAIEGVRQGHFSPDMSDLPDSFDGLRALIDEARTGLEAVTEDEMTGFLGGDMEFRFGERKIPFVAEDFLLGFSQPNFYFHLTSAYAVLRNQGVPLGKLDYLTKMPIKKD